MLFKKFITLAAVSVSLMTALTAKRAVAVDWGFSGPALENPGLMSQLPLDWKYAGFFGDWDQGPVRPLMPKYSQNLQKKLALSWQPMVTTQQGWMPINLTQAVKDPALNNYFMASFKQIKEFNTPMMIWFAPQINSDNPPYGGQDPEAYTAAYKQAEQAQKAVGATKATLVPTLQATNENAWLLPKYIPGDPAQVKNLALEFASTSGETVDQLLEVTYGTLAGLCPNARFHLSLVLAKGTLEQQKQFYADLNQKLRDKYTRVDTVIVFTGGDVLASGALTGVVQPGQTQVIYNTPTGSVVAGGTVSSGGTTTTVNGTTTVNTTNSANATNTANQTVTNNINNTNNSNSTSNSNADNQNTSNNQNGSNAQAGSSSGSGSGGTNPPPPKP